MKNKLSSNIQVRHNIKPHHNLSMEKMGKGQEPYMVQKYFIISIQKQKCGTQFQTDEFLARACFNMETNSKESSVLLKIKCIIAFG